MNLKIYGSGTHWSGNGESADESLKTCPFCTSLNIEVSNTHTPSYWAECRDCGAQGPRTTYPKREAEQRRERLWNYGARNVHIRLRLKRQSSSSPR